jgi:hypothetical protein
VRLTDAVATGNQSAVFPLQQRTMDVRTNQKGESMTTYKIETSDNTGKVKRTVTLWLTGISRDEAIAFANAVTLKPTTAPNDYSYKIYEFIEGETPQGCEYVEQRLFRKGFPHLARIDLPKLPPGEHHVFV